jgi:hypothetical protein
LPPMLTKTEKPVAIYFAIALLIST